MLAQDQFGLGVENTFTITVSSTPIPPSDITLNVIRSRKIARQANTLAMFCDRS